MHAGLQENTAASFLESQVSPDISSRIGLIDLIRTGFSIKLIEEIVQATDLSLKDLTDYGVIAVRTLTHSRQSGRFSAIQSDRLARFFRIFNMTNETFGNTDKAKHWPNRNTRALNGQKPVELLDTEEGARLVEDLLNRISHGLGA
jgi:putative toxin-antitoxin system antitoxin component (TIGR02293 family)